MEEVLGIDIGGSGIKGAMVDIRTGEFIGERHRIETPENTNPELIADIVNEIVKHFSWKGKVGCGFPGVIQNGVIKTSANLSNEWVGVNAEKLFSETIGCKVKLLNDADAAGYAEFNLGAGKDIPGLVVLITIGTGIGSVLYYNDTLIPNTEFGHLFFKNMIAEHYASDAARKKNGLSREEWAGRFNEYLLHLEFLLWPELIILGGGASKKFNKYAEYITTKTKVVPAQLLNSAGIIGASLYANKMLKD